MAYSSTDDLLLGDLLLPAEFDLDKWVNLASDEMDSRLGFTYVIPLTGLTDTESLFLRDINNKLASGRLILAQAIGGEDNRLQAYGESLIKDALASLNALTMGDIDLSAAPRIEESADNADAPGVINHDHESLMLGFENTVLRGEPWLTRPGAEM